MLQSGRRPLTGARIETNSAGPSFIFSTRRPLTGARIETKSKRSKVLELRSPPHRGADRNPMSSAKSTSSGCRPLTGARIETCWEWVPTARPESPPHRGADRNTSLPSAMFSVRRSPPHRGADRNPIPAPATAGTPGRPLTGARIETTACSEANDGDQVAPSQGRGSKQQSQVQGNAVARRPLTGVRIETPRSASSIGYRAVTSPPHRGADRNVSSGSMELSRPRRLLTGARIETHEWPPLGGIIGSPHRGADRNC